MANHLIGNKPYPTSARALCLRLRLRTPRAQARNKKLGIATFDCHEDPFEPGTFHFWERYNTAADMASFNSSPAQQAFHEKVAPLLKDGIGMVLYEWSDGKLGASALPIGPKGEGGLDDATGQSGGAGGGAGYTQTSATVELGKHHREEKGDAFGLKAALSQGLAALTGKAPK